MSQLSMIDGKLVLINGTLAMDDTCCACLNCPTDISGCAASFTLTFSDNNSNASFACGICSGSITVAVGNTLTRFGSLYSGALANSGSCVGCPSAIIQCDPTNGWRIGLADDAAVIYFMYPNGYSSINPNYDACPPTGSWASEGGSGDTFAATLA